MCVLCVCVVCGCCEGCTSSAVGGMGPMSSCGRRGVRGYRAGCQGGAAVGVKVVPRCCRGGYSRRVQQACEQACEQAPCSGDRSARADGGAHRLPNLWLLLLGQVFSCSSTRPFSGIGYWWRPTGCERLR